MRGACSFGRRCTCARAICAECGRACLGLNMELVHHRRGVPQARRVMGVRGGDSLAAADGHSDRARRRRLLPQVLDRERLDGAARARGTKLGSRRNVDRAGRTPALQTLPPAGPRSRRCRLRDALFRLLCGLGPLPPDAPVCGLRPDGLRDRRSRYPCGTLSITQHCLARRSRWLRYAADDGRFLGKSALLLCLRVDAGRRRTRHLVCAAGRY